MNSQSLFSPVHKLLWLAVVTTVVVVLIGLRLDDYSGFHMPDELIVINVVHWMTEHSSWDTNWANVNFHGAFHASTFQYDQYNFSSYHYFMLLLSQLTSVSGGVEDVLFYRGASAAFQFSTVLVIVLFCLRFFDKPTAFIAVVIYAVIPTLVQDAHYARVESFLGLLTMLTVYFSALYWQTGQRTYLWWAFALIGICIASKINFVLMVVVPLWAVWRCQRIILQPGDTLRLGQLRLLATGAGLVLVTAFLTAPYAFIHYEKFWSGVQFLLGQYNPEALRQVYPGSVWLFQLQRIVGFFVATLGLPLCSLFVFAIVVLARSHKSLLGLLGMPILLYVLLVAQYPVFYERNLSHILPLAVVLMAVGLRQLFAFISQSIKQTWVLDTVQVMLLAVVCSVPFEISRLYVAEYLLNPEGTNAKLIKYEETYLSDFADKERYVQRVLYPITKDLLALHGNKLWVVKKMHHPLLPDHAATLKENGYQQVGHYSDLIRALPVSTLTEYPDASERLYFIKRQPYGEPNK